MGKRRYTVSFIGGFFLGQVLRLPGRLIEDAIMGWINQQISGRFNLGPPESQIWANFLFDWALPTALGVLIVWACIKYAAPRVRKSSVNPKGKGAITIHKVTSYNQSDGITTYTVNLGRQKFAFTDEVGQQLLAKLPRGKPIVMHSIGSQSNQQIANKIQQFLTNNGFRVQRCVFGVKAPPPDQPLTIEDCGDRLILTVDPNAG